jgi:hypothetical protein
MTLFEVVMQQYVRQTWFDFAFMPIERLPPTLAHAPNPEPILRQRDAVLEHMEHWKVQAYQNICSAQNQNPPGKIQDEIGNQSEGKSRHPLEPETGLLANPEATLNKVIAARALGVNVRTISRWVRDKKLTPVGLAKRKRFKVKDLQKLLNDRTSDKQDKNRT